MTVKHGGVGLKIDHSEGLNVVRSPIHCIDGHVETIPSGLSRTQIDTQIMGSGGRVGERRTVSRGWFNPTYRRFGT